MILNRFRLGGILLAGLGAGCDQQTKPVDPPTRITYLHSGCYGWCPAFTITVDRSGHGIFEGGAYTAVHGKRTFTASRKDFDAFAAALEPAQRRAKRLDPKKNLFDQIKADSAYWCPPDAPSATDNGDLTVMWSGARSTYFYAYFGCDLERNRKLYEALDKAPDKLGLSAMIGQPGPMTKP